MFHSKENLSASQIRHTEDIPKTASDEEECSMEDKQLFSQRIYTGRRLCLLERGGGRSIQIVMGIREHEQRKKPWKFIMGGEVTCNVIVMLTVGNQILI